MTILFTEQRPSVYLKSQIYDPDIDGNDPNGQIIPRVGSLVIDTPNEGVLYWVEDVDEITFKSTLIVAKTTLLAPINNNPPNDESYIIDYGNTKFNLFFDLSAVPTKLSIDKKLIIVGNESYYYKLYKFNSAINEYEVISDYFDNNTQQYTGGTVPLITAVPTNVKGFDDCVTIHNIQNGDRILIRIFNRNDNQIGEIVTIAKEGVITSPITDPNIVDFYLSATQELNDDFYLYPNQSLDTLMITPILVYNDGRESIVPIDNNVCYMYSDLQYFVPSFPGQKAKVLIKYFLATNQNVTQNDNFQVIDPGGAKHLVVSKDIIVLDNENISYDVKISVIPTYITGANTWKLYFYLYTVGNTNVVNITDDADVKMAFQEDGDFLREFDGNEFNKEQLLKITYDLKLAYPNLSTPLIHTQTTGVKLNAKSSDTSFENYLIRDIGNDIDDSTTIVYGAEGGANNRPILKLIDVDQKYQIPQSIFSTKTKMLEDFYYKANPPYLLNQTHNAVPSPTHFLIRDILTGTILTTDKIDITSDNGYLTEFTIINQSINDLTGSNCIVEFLKYDDTTMEYIPLYGVPVDVFSDQNN